MVMIFFIFQLSVSANRFQDNVDNYLTNIVPSNLVLLRLPYDLWNTICPTTVNAYYLPMMNNICQYGSILNYSVRVMHLT